MAEIPIPAGYGVPLVDLETRRLPDLTMEIINDEAMAAARPIQAAAAASAGVATQAANRADSSATRAEQEADAAAIARGAAVANAVEAMEGATLASQYAQSAAEEAAQAAASRLEALGFSTSASESAVASEAARTGAVTARAGAEAAKTAAEAARDLALAGQFAGAPLAAGANLNTIIAPGVYRQSAGANATAELNYPAPGVAGSLRVSPISSAWLAQEYIPLGTSATRPVYGYYLRKMQGEGVWAPWRFVPTQRVDQTAGRAIYTWDDVNNREQLIYGDTGWRDVTSLLLNGWTSEGPILLRRMLYSVELVMLGLVDTASTDATVLTILPGFQPVRNVVLRVVGDRGVTVRSAERDIRIVRTGSRLGDQYNGASVSWSTATSWPTSLPGTSTGGIPNA